MQQDLLKQKLRAYTNASDMIDHIEKDNEKILKELYQKCAESFSKDNGLDIVVEEVNALAMGIERLTGLVQKGVEVYAPLTQDNKSLKDSFPANDEYIKALETAQQLLLHEKSSDSE